MKNKIPQFLQEKLNLLGTTPIKRFPDEIKQFMLNYSKYYDWKIEKVNIIFKLMKNGIAELDECEYIGCTNKKKIIWDGTITRGCCKEHTTKITNLEKYGCEWNISSKNNREKAKQTNLEKLGVENPLQSDIIKDKIKKTNLMKFGVSNVSHNKDILLKKERNNMMKYGKAHTLQLDDVKNKIKETNLERYGIENIFMLDSVKDKIKETNLERYGSKCIFSSEWFVKNDQVIREKIKETNLERYGFVHHTQSPIIQYEIKQRNLKKYGVSHPMQLPEIAEKQQKSCYHNKEYLWKTGETSILQGNEPQVLLELETQGFTYNEILTDKKDMPEIYYTLNNKRHRYFPDFYIPKENLIIEVKSEWTLHLHWDKNKAKFQAVKEAGYNFKLEVR